MAGPLMRKPPQVSPIRKEGPVPSGRYQWQRIAWTSMTGMIRWPLLFSVAVAKEDLELLILLPPLC